MSQRFLILIVTLTLTLALAGVLSLPLAGCSSLLQHRNASSSSEVGATTVVPPRAAAIDESTALNTLEKQLSNVRSDRVIVSTRLLRTLVQGEHARQEKCQTLNEQLNAIKTIDLEETRATQ